MLVNTLRSLGTEKTSCKVFQREISKAFSHSFIDPGSTLVFCEHSSAGTPLFPGTGSVYHEGGLSVAVCRPGEHERCTFSGNQGQSRQQPHGQTFSELSLCTSLAAAGRGGPRDGVWSRTCPDLCHTIPCSSHLSLRREPSGQYAVFRPFHRWKN